MPPDGPTRMYCCHVEQEDHTGCGREPGFLVSWDSMPDSYYHSCGDHLAAMITIIGSPTVTVSLLGPDGEEVV